MGRKGGTEGWGGLGWGGGDTEADRMSESWSSSWGCWLITLLTAGCLEGRCGHSSSMVATQAQLGYSD